MKAIINANVFDGRNAKLKEHAAIVIDGNKVKEITSETIELERFEQVIDAGGKTAVPGLTDAHVHISSCWRARLDEQVIGSVKIAREMLRRGFTTVRDAGGITCGLKWGIDEGIIEGPRIYPSNAYLTQTCGHGDCRASRAEYRITDGIYASGSVMKGGSYYADGVSEVLRGTREQLFLGASQIKIMAGGGVSSTYDPIQTVQFTFEEMKAAVDAARDYGTYVMAHLYTPEAMQRAARAGVKSFEHGQLMDEETAKVIADNNIFVDPCPNFTKMQPDDHIFRDPARRAKRDLVLAGVQRQAELINKYDLPLIFGTDYVDGAPTSGDLQLADLSHYKELFGSYKGLLSATGNINELIKLTTYQNPYPDGKIGLLEEGSYADLLLVDGNPVENLDILADTRNIRLVMKDAVIFKNTLDDVRIS